MKTTTWDRALHLVDIENLIGHARPTLAEVASCYEAYRSWIGDHDLVVVACNHGAFPAVAWGWPGARRLVRSGQDGADRELLDVLAFERVEDRFKSVGVACGDGIFTDAVAWLGGTGVSVTVVSRSGALSRRLRMAARDILLVPAATAATASWPRSAEPA